MATVTASRVATGQPVGSAAPAGVMQVAWGTYTAASNLAATTIIEFCKVPAGATVIGGYFQAADLDTGTEEIDIDIGWAANGVESADPDGFGNNDVITGDVSVHTPVASIYIPLHGVLIGTGPQYFTKETTIQAVINVDAATGGTGVMTVVVFYTMV